MVSDEVPIPARRMKAVYAGAWEASPRVVMKLAASVGDTYVTNRGRPILTFVEDASNCAHDTLMAPCDRDRYALLGVKGYHDSCQEATATQSSDSTATGTSPRSAGSHSLAEPAQGAR